MTERILIFFALGAAGFLFRRYRIIGSAGTRDLVRLNLDVLLPALTFSIAADRLTPAMAGLERGFAGALLGLPLTAVVIVAVGGLLGWVTAPFTGLNPRSRRTYIFLLAFANCTFLPIPLSYALKGEAGILFVNLYFLGYTLLIWTVGKWVVKGSASFRSLLNPNVIALVLGAAIGTSGVRLPPVLLEVLKMVGSSLIPLGLIYSGAVLAEQKLILGADTRSLVFMSAIKLVILPLIALAFLSRVRVPEPMASQAILQAAMPCMAQSGIYVAHMGGDVSFASKAAVVTTILCVVSVPFFLGIHG